MNLRRNQITDEGIKYLSAGINQNTSLEYLELLRNQITTVGAEKYLIPALQENYSLRKLLFDFGNEINA